MGRTQTVVALSGDATIDGVVVEFTAKEEAARDAEEQKHRDYEHPAEEMRAIRDHRTRLLAETDWTGISDLTMSDAMKTYRQELRDIPASNTIYENVTWPTKPE